MSKARSCGTRGIVRAASFFVSPAHKLMVRARKTEAPQVSEIPEVARIKVAAFGDSLRFSWSRTRLSTVHTESLGDTPMTRQQKLNDHMVLAQRSTNRM